MEIVGQSFVINMPSVFTSLAKSIKAIIHDHPYKYTVSRFRQGNLPLEQGD